MISPKCAKVGLRFMNYQQRGAKCTKLGLISEDGMRFIDISANYLLPRTLLSYLQNRNDVQVLENSLPQLEEHDVTSDIRLKPIINPSKIISVGSPFIDRDKTTENCPSLRYIPSSALITSKAKTISLPPKVS